MKNIILIVLLISALSCKSQSPIVDLDASRWQTVDGAYFKDTNNDLGRLVGTWMFSEGNQTFKIQLKKIENFFDERDYEDLLYGAYSYYENGIEIINTLPSLSNTNVDPYNRNIIGNLITPNNRYTPCNNCDSNTRRITLYFSDPQRTYLTAHILVIQYINETQITATVVPTHGVIIPNENSPTVLRVPNGTYTMIKL